jgi:hypothetical protein
LAKLKCLRLLGSCKLKKGRANPRRMDGSNSCRVR